MFEFQPIKGDIGLRDVYFAYPNRRQFPVLNHLTISATFGRTVALVGPSGCGKSTVIQLLERFYDVIDGAIVGFPHIFECLVVSE